MTGGNYLTIFLDNEDRILRSHLYKLETLGIFKQVKEKQNGIINYKWLLTEKGKDLLEKNEYLKKLSDKKDYLKFYEEIEKTLGN